MQDITWQDLIGTWRSVEESHPPYDLSVLEKGHYVLTTLEDGNSNQGNINSSYNTGPNTVTLHLDDHDDIEFWMTIKDSIILIINDVKCTFKKLM